MIAESGLQILMYAESLAEGRRDTEEFRRSLLASGLYDPKKLYASDDTLTSDTPEGQQALAQGAQEDYSGVKWMAPSDLTAQNSDISLDDLEALIRSNSSVTVTGSGGTREEGWV